MASSTNVLVIGAGMAGLAAGRSLRDAGYQVRILEARDRIGGRTYTDRSLGIDIDLGAAWIHGPHGNPLVPLAQRYGVTWGYTDFNNDYGKSVQAYAADGRPLDTAAYTRGGRAFRAAMVARHASLLYDWPDESVRTAADLRAYGLPGIDLDQMAPDEQLGYHYAAVVRPQYEEAADLAEIDWRLSDRYIKLPGGDLLLHGGGYRRLIEGLGAGLDIRTGTPVHHIAYDEEGILVTTPYGAMAAGTVVLTVPLGVLQSGGIAFDPPLPAAKKGAIGRIGFGCYEKLAMRFPSIFWPTTPHRLNYLAEGEPELYNAWLNLAHYTGEPVLVSYHAGSRARYTNHLSDEELVAGCMAVLRRLFGPGIPDPVQTVRSGWEKDPYARGSYSFARIGQKVEDRDLLRAPVADRLFFAGEATHPRFWGTVHGAYETGLLAARHIIARDRPPEDEA